MTDKVIVKTNEGGEVKVLEGSNYVKLEDFTQSQFVTNSIGAFVEYCNTILLSTTWPVYVSEDKISCVNNIDIDRHTTDAATATINETGISQRVRRLCKTYTVALLESELRRLLEYGDKRLVELYNFTRNMNITSEINLRREITDDGEAEVMFSRKNKGEKKLRPVEKFTLSFPLIEMHEDLMQIDFGVSIDFCDDMTKVNIEIYNDNLDEIFKLAKKSIIYAHLGKLHEGRKVFWGNYKKILSTDEWRYHRP